VRNIDYKAVTLGITRLAELHPICLFDLKRQNACVHGNMSKGDFGVNFELKMGWVELTE